MKYGDKYRSNTNTAPERQRGYDDNEYDTFSRRAKDIVQEEDGRAVAAGRVVGEMENGNDKDDLQPRAPTAGMSTLDTGPRTTWGNRAGLVNAAHGDGEEERRSSSGEGFALRTGAARAARFTSSAQAPSQARHATRHASVWEAEAPKLARQTTHPEKRAPAPIFESRPCFYSRLPAARCRITPDSVATYHINIGRHAPSGQAGHRQYIGRAAPSWLTVHRARRSESKLSHARVLVDLTRRILQRLLIGIRKRWRELKVSVEEHTSREKAVV
ncbi:hypothetical protein JB92DRAFT_2829919 [Gautieria morchelliformis]|nr:hypothetical protein JB92DRAFT_2829919 [Gautieria morchelliformis]